MFGMNGNYFNPLEGFHGSLFAGRCHNSDLQTECMRRQCGICRCAARTGAIPREVLCNVTHHEIIYRLERDKIRHISIIN